MKSHTGQRTDYYGATADDRIAIGKSIEVMRDEKEEAVRREMAEHRGVVAMARDPELHQRRWMQ